MLRGLGLPLDEIAGVLDQARDQVQTLRRHHRALLAESKRRTAVMAEHHALVSKFWTPDRASYTALGQMYVDDPRFRARYDARHLALAVYLRDAMEVYGEAHLS